jgi:hypothetical protein
VTPTPTDTAASSTPLAGEQLSMVDSLVYVLDEPANLASGAFTIALHRNLDSTTGQLEMLVENGPTCLSKTDPPLSGF